MKKTAADFAPVLEYFERSQLFQVVEPIEVSSIPFILEKRQKYLDGNDAVRYTKLLMNCNTQIAKVIRSDYSRIDGLVYEEVVKSIKAAAFTGWIGDLKKSNPVVDCVILHVRGLVSELILDLPDSSIFQQCYRLYRAGYWPCGYRGKYPAGSLVAVR